ncbi:hypothetical protein BDB01DRAFT_724500 [Pilobolus umbonatus]|nr:hypothetical protein BDB01DRAFT_724500 [Pilobolus umbonatus]
MINNRVLNLCLAVGVGVATGVYIFRPLLKEYEHDTRGTWIPNQDPLKDIDNKKQ